MRDDFYYRQHQAGAGDGGYDNRDGQGNEATHASTLERHGEKYRVFGVTDNNGGAFLSVCTRIFKSSVDSRLVKPDIGKGLSQTLSIQVPTLAPGTHQVAVGMGFQISQDDSDSGTSTDSDLAIPPLPDREGDPTMTGLTGINGYWLVFVGKPVADTSVENKPALLLCWGDGASQVHLMDQDYNSVDWAAGSFVKLRFDFLTLSSTAAVLRVYQLPAVTDDPNVPASWQELHTQELSTSDAGFVAIPAGGRAGKVGLTAAHKGTFNNTLGTIELAYDEHGWYATDL